MAYVGKTINTLHERFHGNNGHLNPATKSSPLLEHLAPDANPKCEFKTKKHQNSCNSDFRFRYAESIHLKLSKQTLNTQERSIPLALTSTF